MKVDGVSLQGEQVFKAKMPVPVQLEVEEIPQDSPPAAQIDEPSPTEPQSDIQNADDTEEDGKGVLRLLQEGHFKGVSDVRLRINFFEQLTAIEAGKLQAVAEEKVNGVLESVGGIVDTFLAAEENELTEEQTAGVSELQESFVQAVSGYTNEPVTDLNNAFLNNAFDEFVKALRNLFAPPVQTQEENTTTEAESPDAPELPWQTFIEDLKSAFTTTTNELSQAFAEVRILPELSEPNGNGVAYEKFLAIYNELRGLQSPTDEQPDSEPLDSAV
ncbi:MAG TPA: hypothetical protein VMW72_11725 [Sedimentisphaerales bacterium]|nr:hypothetical protein [Sedimentisphaerales bacterium]